VTGVLTLLVAVVGGGGYYGWTMTQSEYYVGVANGKVAVFRGVNQAVAGVSLSSVVQQTNIPLSEVPPVEAKQIRATLPPGTLAQARRTLTQINQDYQCVMAQTELRAWLANRPRTAPPSRPAGRHAAARHPSGHQRTRKRKPTRPATTNPAPMPSITPGLADKHPTYPPRPALPRYCAVPSGGSE
jgi:protein phosphatase